jgi:hypothetical protein
MDNIRRPVPVTVPHVVSLSNEEVDRVVLKRLKEIAYGISVEYEGLKSPACVKYYGYPYSGACREEDILKLRDIRDNEKLHELYISYLAYLLESALRMGPLKTPVNPSGGMLDY